MQKQGCDSKKGHHKKSLRPLFYALEIMELRDQPEISLAVQSYRMNKRSLDRSLNSAAFKEGTFDRERFVNEHYMTKKVNAQAALFESVFKVLNEEQKVRLHQLMAADLFYNSQRKKACADKKACDTKRACDGTGPKRDGTGPNPDCPKKQ